MFRHVVMFRWTPDATAEAKASVASRLAELPDAIATVRGYHVGADAGLVDGNWDFVVIAEFDDADGYLTYRDHATHRAVIAEAILPIVAERAAIQCSAPD